MSGFLKFLLIAILIYWGVRILARVLAPLLISYFFRKTHRNIYDKYEREDRKKEGEVTIDYTPEKDKDKKKRGNDGEYVEYEEVE